jgi:hypothetical protein
MRKWELEIVDSWLMNRLGEIPSFAEIESRIQREISGKRNRILEKSIIPYVLIISC